MQTTLFKLNVTCSSHWQCFWSTLLSATKGEKPNLKERHKSKASPSDEIWHETRRASPTSLCIYRPAVFRYFLWCWMRVFYCGFYFSCSSFFFKKSYRITFKGKPVAERTPLSPLFLFFFQSMRQTPGKLFRIILGIICVIQKFFRMAREYESKF